MKKHTQFKYCIVIPCHNEVAIIDKTLHKLTTYCDRIYKKEDWQIVVVDNGSSKYAKAATDRYHNVKYMCLSNPGRGGALKYALKNTSATYYEYIDADLPVKLSVIANSFRKLETGKADIVIIKRQGKRPLIRRVLTRLLQLTNWAFCGLKHQDAQAGFQAINAKARNLLISLPDNGFYLHSQLLIYAQKLNLNIIEVPATWIDSRYKERASTVKILRNSFSMFGNIITTAINTTSLVKIIRNSLIIMLAISILLIVYGNHDPDFGWHVSVGKWILANNIIPLKDNLSFTMSGHHWVDFEWLQNIVFWLLTSHNLKWLLVLAFTAFSLIPWLYWLRKEKSLFFSTLVITAALNTFTIIGIRPQQVTFFLFFLLLLILQSPFWQNTAKWFKTLLISIFFLIWANLHAGFFGGLIVLFCFLFLPNKWTTNLSVWKNKWRENWPILIAVLLITLINPYGWKIYQEIYYASLSPLTNKYISEWLPISTFDRSSIILVSVIVGAYLAFIYKYWRKLTPPLIVSSVFFLLQAIVSTRMVSLFMILAVAQLYEALSVIRKEHINNKLIAEYKWLGAAAMLILLMVIGNNTISVVDRNNPPPVAGMNALYVLNKYEDVRVFNLYSWGGAMSLYLPEIKDFIDGRMPHWKDPILNINAMADYMQVTRDPDDISPTDYNWQEVFDKWQINTVFIDGNNTFTNELLENGWRLFYKDKNSVVITKINI